MQTFLHQNTQKTLSKRFKIIKLLGKGSFGNVYQCIELKNNQIYAIKVISKFNVRKSKIQCLRQQATLLLSLDHENIVKVYQFFQDQTVIFIKMQCLNNGTLGQLIKQRQAIKSKFTDDQVAQIMSSIFQAVNYIHSKSILHRDIKPQNILVSDKKQLKSLKIADFGLGAKVQFRSPTATSKCGTYLYMAPQILWNYTYTKAVDIWSCAIIMYILKKGTHPFYEPKMSNQEFKLKIKTVVFPSLDEENPQNLSNYSSKTKQTEISLFKKKKQFLAQDLMKRISKLSPNQRYTAQDVIKHPWITRNFEQEIPLSLHDSYSGFEISHQLSLLMKMSNLLKQMFFKKDQYEKIRKTDSYQKYIKKCENFNHQDRCPSPLKVRRLSNINSTRQIRELCQLSQLSISPKKQKQTIQKNVELTDDNNPTIMKLNMIFNNLFQKKEKKPLNYAEQFMKNVQENTDKFYQQRQRPDISAYKQTIEFNLAQIVKQRHKRKKIHILPLKKKNQYGEVIGKGCDVKNCFKNITLQNKKNDLQIAINLQNTPKNNALQNKIRVKRRISNNSLIGSLNSINNVSNRYKNL